MTLPIQQHESEVLLALWDRIGIAVRCGYHPFCPCAVRAYLEFTRRVVDSGLRTETAAQRRALNVLLQTARDEALPWYWRSVCLEHATFPLMRLNALLKDSDPIAVHAINSAAQVAQDVLAATAARSGREH